MKITADKECALRKQVLDAVAVYYNNVHAARGQFSPGQHIPYAGRVFDEKEMVILVEAALDFWLTADRFSERFEDAFAEFLGVEHCGLTNSGSSANLLAFMALTSPKLGERRIRRGDEVITVAAGFPTTVAPIVQYGAIPVFVDVTLPTYNIDVRQLETAFTVKTKAVMLAHTMGNPFDLQTVRAFCDKHGLWLVEDNCDALGAKFLYNGEWRHTGTIGHIGTSSFYPPHQMTMGEGGAVYTNDRQLAHIIASCRDWGRDCWCPPGRDGTCKRRFCQQFGVMPYGYDHKYIYSHFGYNLRATEMQAAIGCAQLEKLPGFIAARKRNWHRLRTELDDLERWFVLPEATAGGDPSWFGFLLTVRDDAGFTREGIVKFLESNGIQTRMLFAGNLVKQPCFDEMRQNGKGYRIVGELENTDSIMLSAFWTGVYPGLSEDRIAFVAAKIREYVVHGARP